MLLMFGAAAKERSLADAHDAWGCGWVMGISKQLGAAVPWEREAS